jgi:hypothetical protein
MADSNVSPPARISSTGMLLLPGDFYFFNFAIAVSASRRLGPGTNGSAARTSIYLTSLTLCTFNN